MNTAIIFTSRHGSTRKVAQAICDQLGHGRCTLINLRENPNPELHPYDSIVIGGSIHAGSIQKAVKAFCAKHHRELREKPLALFACGMNVPQYEQQLETAFPAELREHAVFAAFVGGEFLFHRMNLVERLIVKRITGMSESSSHLDPHKVHELVTAIRLATVNKEQNIGPVAEAAGHEALSFFVSPLVSEYHAVYNFL